MITLDVIGDSYSDENHYCIKDSTTKRIDLNKPYLEILRDNYNFQINNYSWNGIGATQSIERLMHIKYRNNFLLFLLPQINRIKFKHFQDENVCNNYVKYKQKKLPKDIQLNYESVYSSNVLNNYETLCVSYVCSYSNIYEKILIWPISKYNFTGINKLPKNCHLIKKHLEEISSEEFIDTTEGSSSDFRNNHLSKENHVILSKQLRDFFVDDILPNEKSYVKNCYDFKSYKNFIYE